MIGFHGYLDGERQKRKLSWAQLAEEVNRPFTNTPSIPIHPATLRDMPKKRSVTSAVVLQVLRWLGRSPEAFLVPPDEESQKDATLPEAAMNHVLQLDGGTSGTDVAYEFGYYDWMYMVHDFAEFTSGTPTETLNPLEAVFVERIRTVGPAHLSQ